MDHHAIGETHAGPAAVDAVLTASRSMGAAAEVPAQYRAPVVLACRGPRRIAYPAGHWR
jgi:hypothetical protein